MCPSKKLYVFFKLTQQKVCSYFVKVKVSSVKHVEIQGFHVHMTTSKSFPNPIFIIKYNNDFGLKPTWAVVLPTTIFAHCRQINDITQ